MANPTGSLESSLLPLRSSQPEGDPCRANSTFSLRRFALFTLAFLIMIPGSAILFIVLCDRPFGIQLASAICYSAAIILYTFSSNRGMQRYLFQCPYVRPELPRLAMRHLGFLVALVVILTAALNLRPHLPHYWLVASGAPRSVPPYITVLFLLCIALAFTQIFTNRSLLNRAHL